MTDFTEKIHQAQSENNAMLTAVPQNIDEHAMQNTGTSEFHQGGVNHEEP